jgi:methylenetetrahydrofolate reductase (NADH)
MSCGTRPFSRTDAPHRRLIVCNYRRVALSEVDAAVATADVAAPAEPRYEVLPFKKAEEQAAEVGERLRLTITTSPRHGVDRSLDVAERLRALGHEVTVHVAARMVRAAAHADEIVERAKAAGIDDLLVIGGDVSEPLGPYVDAAEFLERVAAHPSRPARLGIGGYPEGHPLIPTDELDAALERKAGVADYLVTQLCFDVQALISWIDGLRARGISLPLYAGAAGHVDRRRLLEISTKVGVGPSLRFLRKQRGLATLFRSPTDTAARFYDAVAPRVGDPRLGIAGFHLFTFNDLLATRRWVEKRSERRG